MYASIIDRFNASTMAKCIAAVTLPTFGGYTVRQALGVSGCLAIADAIERAREPATSGYAETLDKWNMLAPVWTSRNQAEEEWGKVWERFAPRALCGSCGGQGQGPPVPVCCGNWQMGRDGSAECCNNPAFEPDGCCSDCGGSGFVETPP